MREFSTGATRDSDDGKFDYEGFLSPRVLECYAAYMHKHRKQADGNLRDADNWQKGMPTDQYMKSMWRHFFDVWKIHRGIEVLDVRDGHKVTLDEALCALLFNVMGYMHEELKPMCPPNDGAVRPNWPTAAESAQWAEGDEKCAK